MTLRRLLVTASGTLLVAVAVGRSITLDAQTSGAPVYRPALKPPEFLEPF